MQRTGGFFQDLDDGEEVLALVLELGDPRGQPFRFRVGESRVDRHVWSFSFLIFSSKSAASRRYWGSSTSCLGSAGLAMSWSLGLLYAAELEGIGIALYLFGDVGDRPRRLPVRLIAQRIDGEGCLVMAQLDIGMHQAGAIARGNVLSDALRGEAAADERRNENKREAHEPMIVGPLIERKRDGAALSPEEWSALVAEYTADRIPDYQIAALLMAVFLRGLERH